MRKVFLESPVCKTALDAGNSIEEFERVFTAKFGTVTDDEILFFGGKYEMFSNRVLGMMDFIGFDNEQFLFELADTMNQNSDAVIHRQISPFFRFTADLLENSCVFRHTKCRPLLHDDRTICEHSWCLKFNDVHVAIREATRSGKSRVIVALSTDVHRDENIDITVHPTLYTSEEIRRASKDDLVVMRVRNRTQVVVATYDVQCRASRMMTRMRATTSRYVADLYHSLVDDTSPEWTPSNYHAFPRDVILDVEAICGIGTCPCVRASLDDMSPTEYRDYMYKLPIQTTRVFAHDHSDPTDQDTAWTIAMPFIEKCGLLPYLNVNMRRRARTHIPRTGRFHVFVTSGTVRLVREYYGDITIDTTPNTYMFDVPIIGALPTVTCVCDNPHRSYLVPIDRRRHTQLWFEDRAIDLGITPENLVLYTVPGFAPLSLSPEQAALINEYKEYLRSPAATVAWTVPTSL